MRSRWIIILALGAAAAGFFSCTERGEAPRLPVQQGWVPDDRVEACLGPMLRAPMPVYYLMPVDRALGILGEPHGETNDLVFLRNFPRTRRARAYSWYTRAATLYLVYDQKSRLVQTLIVVDEATNTGVELLLTREEVLSAQIKPGMGVGEVYRIMGKPDRIERFQAPSRDMIDRFWYEPPPDVAPPVYIDINQRTLKVVRVSTARTEETGPPSETE